MILRSYAVGVEKVVKTAYVMQDIELEQKLGDVLCSFNAVMKNISHKSRSFKVISTEDLLTFELARVK